MTPIYAKVRSPYPGVFTPVLLIGVVDAGAVVVREGGQLWLVPYDDVLVERPNSEFPMGLGDFYAFREPVVT